MTNKSYTIIVNGTEVYVSKYFVDGKPQWEVRIQNEVGDKTFTTETDPEGMIIKAIMAPYSVFVGEDPNIELAIGFQDEEMALTWMRQLPPEDGRKAWMVTSAAYFDSNSYRYL